MIWSDKTKEAVAKAIYCQMPDLEQRRGTSPWYSTTLVELPYFEACEESKTRSASKAQAALAAVAESDEWKAKEQEIKACGEEVEALEVEKESLEEEIERLKMQVSVLREACENEGHAATGVDKHDVCAICQALAAADKVGEE